MNNKSIGIKMNKIQTRKMLNPNYLFIKKGTKRVSGLREDLRLYLLHKNYPKRFKKRIIKGNRKFTVPQCFGSIHEKITNEELARKHIKITSNSQYANILKFIFVPRDLFSDSDSTCSYGGKVSNPNI